MKKIFMIFAAFAAIAMVSCNKDKGGDEAVDPTGGIDVAKENLVVYLSFDDDAVQLGKDITFDGRYLNAVLAQGVRGKAYKNNAASNTEEAYAVYNLGTNNPFKDMSSFTISCWMKCPDQNGGDPGTACLLSVNGGDAGMGSLVLERENWVWGDDATGLAMKGYIFNNREGVEWPGHDIGGPNPAFEDDKWFLMGFQYNEEDSKLSLWANGVMIFDSERWAAPKPEEGEQPHLGKLEFKPDMTKLYIGAWKKQVENKETADDWMGYYPGSIDELRIYNKALSEQEMLALYQAEVKAMD